MNRIGTTLAALGLCVAAAACQNPQQKIAAKEDMMTGAGFKFVPANTPARQQSFKQLPAHRFSRQIRDGRVFYVYPDPTVCVCLYVGDQKAYGTYNFNVLQKSLADQQEAAADEIWFPHLWTLIRAGMYRAEDAAADVGGAVEALGTLFRAFDRGLAGREYWCDGFSVADIGTIIFVSAAGSLGAPLPDDVPNMRAWRERVVARPAVRAVLADMNDAAARAFAA